jgi:hypothetical protein
MSLTGFHPLWDTILSQNLKAVADQGCQLEGSSPHKGTAYRGVFCTHLAVSGGKKLAGIALTAVHQLPDDWPVTVVGRNVHGGAVLKAHRFQPPIPQTPTPQPRTLAAVRAGRRRRLVARHPVVGVGV